MAEQPLLSYHASHEQHAPEDLLRYVQRAELRGFAGVLCSDHFHPWTEEQGHSGFAWSWLGAALQATSTMQFGTVNAPGWRYHPAIIAQAAATLARMYPGRFWLAAGSGEALNEHITGERWPVKAQRNERLAECVAIMRALWAGETVTHHGLVTVEEARLFTLPEEPPLLFGAALTEETAHWVGSWADGMITVGAPPDRLQRVVAAFRSGGGMDKPMKVQVALSWATEHARALQQAHDEWGSQVFPSHVLASTRMPRDFSALRDQLRPENVADAVHVAAELDRHVEWLRHHVAAGFEEIILFNVGPNQEEFIDVFGEVVLPAIVS